MATADTAGGTGTGSAAADTRPGLGDGALVAITAAVTLPILWLGYGTDLDIGDVRRAGGLIRHLDYAPSRTPGVPVFEALVALLDPLGHVAVNLAAAAALAATVVGLARLVRIWGHANGDLVALAFLASPVVLIAGTSATDFVWAVAFLVWGALALAHDRPVVAGLLLALAIGCRSSTGFLVVALLVADGWAADRRVRALRTLAVAVPAALVLYVPAWLSHSRSLAATLDHTEGWQGLANNLGRFAYKNYAVAGVALLVVLAVAAPALVRALRSWGHDPLLRFAVLGLLATEVLFFQLPWKPAHLIPAVVMVVLWVAASDRNQRSFLWLLVAAIALNGVVSFRPLAPDAPDASTSARFDPAVGWGLLLNDVRCRARTMDLEPDKETGSWSCTLEPVRGPSG